MHLECLGRLRHFADFFWGVFGLNRHGLDMIIVWICSLHGCKVPRHMTPGRPPVVVPPPRPMRCLACKLSNHRKSFTESKIYRQMKFKCLFSQSDYRCREVDVFYDIESFNHHLHDSAISRYLMFRTWGTQTTILYTDCGIHHFYLCLLLEKGDVPSISAIARYGPSYAASEWRQLSDLISTTSRVKIRDLLNFSKLI